jgi:hypothetical protein
MEHDVPQIRVGSLYFFLAIVTGLLTFSSGLRWNLFFELTGVLIPTVYVGTLGTLIALFLGYRDTIEGKPNIYITILYPLGFLISFISCYIFYNKLSFHSIEIRLAIGLVIITLLPGYGLIKLYQMIYNRKLEDKYWEQVDESRRAKGEPTLSDHLKNA